MNCTYIAWHQFQRKRVNIFVVSCYYIFFLMLFFIVRDVYVPMPMLYVFLHTQRLQKVIYLHLSTNCFGKISFHL